MEPKTPATDAGPTILAVDDEPEIRSLISQALVPLGYRVLLARNGELAYRLCKDRSESLDLLITDMLMPGLNGLDLAVKVHALYPRIAVLYLSESLVVGGAFRNAPEVAFLAKPFTIPQLATKVRELLAHSSYSS